MLRVNSYSEDFTLEEQGDQILRHTSRIIMFNARGTQASPSGSQVGDTIFNIRGDAYNPHGTLTPSGLLDNRTIRILGQASVSGTHYLGSDFIVNTSTGGPAIYDNSFRFTHDGKLYINNVNIASPSGLDISNNADNRILTGTGSGINAESNATFDGTTLAVSGIITIDNLKLDDNTISSTNVNGNLILAPNGTGDVQVDADTLRVGDSNSNTTITTNGTGDLILNTNSGTNSGSITIEDGANNDITISPNGTGQIILGKQNSASDPQELSFANGKFSLNGDARFSSYVLMGTTSSNGSNSLYLNYPTNSDDTITIDDTTATFSIHISGREPDSGDSAGFVIRGCVKKYSSIVSLVGSPVIESFLDSNFATADAQISTSSSGLVIQINQGSSGVSGTVYWVASVQISRVQSLSFT